PSRGDFVAIVGRLGQNAWVRGIKPGMIAGGDVPVWSMNAPLLGEIFVGKVQTLESGLPEDLSLLP
ncbi:MAG: hypothetical protein WBO74_19235, partial [Thermoanaerobaculia bacterium]